ncbi:MAG TPA: group 1 truncated hemoglobin [Burkholderiaceae bacterium]|jgi:hemoglobin|nr:group 1 truncated hemoglobin [Burkholderiaceae bacterium]
MKRMLQMMMVLVFAATFAATFSGTVNAQTNTPAAANETVSDAVFQDFGGKAGIGKVIDDFLGIWQADPRISDKLKDADVERLGFLLKEQITQLTGGPAVYSGKDMKTAHQAMGLHNADFNALAEDLQHAMDKNGVPSRAQNKLLAKLAPMEHDIVTK